MLIAYYIKHIELKKRDLLEKEFIGITELNFI